MSENPFVYLVDICEICSLVKLPREMREGIINNGFFGVNPIINTNNKWSGTSVGIELDSLQGEIAIAHTWKRLQTLGRLNQIKAYRSTAS